MDTARGSWRFGQQGRLMEARTPRDKALDEIGTDELLAVLCHFKG